MHSKLKNLSSLQELQLTMELSQKDLTQVRIIKQNLAYLIGLPPELAKEQILSRVEYLGQYGQIKKITIGKNQVCNSDGQLSFAAYINFNNEKEASFAILALADFEIDEGRVIRASYGTTKYCTNFLKNQNCQNLECVYLHHYHNGQKIYQKDEILNKKSIFQEQYQIALNVALKYKQELIFAIDAQDNSNQNQKLVFPSLLFVLDKLLNYEEKNHLIPQETEKKALLESVKQQQQQQQQQQLQQQITPKTINPKKIIKKCQASFVGWDFGNEQEQQQQQQQSPPSLAPQTSASLIESKKNSPQLKTMIEGKSEGSEDLFKMEELQLNEYSSEGNFKTELLEDSNCKLQQSRFNFANYSDDYNQLSEIEQYIQDFIQSSMNEQQIYQEELSQFEQSNDNMWLGQEGNSKNTQSINFEKLYQAFEFNPEEKQQFSSKAKLLKQLSKQESNQFQQQQQYKLTQSLSPQPQILQQQQIPQQQQFSLMKSIYQTPEFDMHINKNQDKQQRVLRQGAYGNIIYNYHTIQYNVNNNINLTNNFYKL